MAEHEGQSVESRDGIRGCQREVGAGTGVTRRKSAVLTEHGDFIHLRAGAIFVSFPVLSSPPSPTTWYFMGTFYGLNCPTHIPVFKF